MEIVEIIEHTDWVAVIVSWLILAAVTLAIAYLGVILIKEKHFVFGVVCFILAIFTAAVAVMLPMIGHNYFVTININDTITYQMVQRCIGNYDIFYGEGGTIIVEFPTKEEFFHWCYLNRDLHPEDFLF